MSAIDKNPYEILGVRQSASQAEIRDAYIKLAKKYHPDNYQNHPLEDMAQTKMQEINFAYDYLTRHDGSTTTSSTNSHNYGSGSTQSGYGQTYGNQGQAGAPYGKQTQGQAKSPFGNQGQQNPYNSFWGNSGRNQNDRNFYNYNRRPGLTGGGCCSDLCMCFMLDSCCECMGGDLCSCC